jgi:hypothetical protein
LHVAWQEWRATSLEVREIGRDAKGEPKLLPEAILRRRLRPIDLTDDFARRLARYSAHTDAVSDTSRIVADADHLRRRVPLGAAAWPCHTVLRAVVTDYEQAPVLFGQLAKKCRTLQNLETVECQVRLRLGTSGGKSDDGNKRREVTQRPSSLHLTLLYGAT